MSHYGPIRAQLAILTVTCYIYGDISACAIEAMIGKWCSPIKIAKFFFLFFFYK